MTEFLSQSAFAQIAGLLVLASLFGAMAHALRQPLVVAFIAAGVAAGPSVLDITHAHDEISLFSELGITMLLFLVGLKLDLQLLRSLGSSALAMGAIQVGATAAAGTIVAGLLGWDAVAALYVGLALAFSSTIIIVKLLSDKREIDALHGQLALGFLIVQDVIVIFAMIALSAGGAAGQEGARGPATIIICGLLLVLTAGFVLRYLAEPVTEYLARLPELLIGFAVALAAIFAALADFGGLGKELGGLMAGIALASTRYREAIGSRLAPLRDFLLMFFFLSLGAEIDLGELGASLPAALAFCLIVLAVKPLVVYVILLRSGYRQRTSFLTALSLGQISEFSLILVGLGAEAGGIGSGTVGTMTLVALVTIAISSYLISSDQRLYPVLEPYLAWFGRERSMMPEQRAGLHGAGYDVIVFGAGRFGTAIGLRLRQSGLRVLGIDFNPAALRRWRELGLDIAYGEAADAEFLAHLPLAGAQWAVSTIPVQGRGLVHDDARMSFIQGLRGAGFAGRIALTSHVEGEGEMLGRAGAALVLEPFQDAADRAIELMLAEIVPVRHDFEAIAGELEGDG